ncbi:MAG: type II toxin-antitoxin system HicB family antitoxin [Candidatus Bathyarchaeota archaeon]|nr:type II toxin-antitoxin system HicB family antitoxin [Candidatus Bathyarchaeota archaeon]
MSAPKPEKFTVLVKAIQEGGYSAHCVEVPVSCQGKTKEEALKNIKEAIESLGWKLNKTPNSQT